MNDCRRCRRSGPARQGRSVTGSKPQMLMKVLGSLVAVLLMCLYGCTEHVETVVTHGPGDQNYNENCRIEAFAITSYTRLSHQTRSYGTMLVMMQVRSKPPGGIHGFDGPMPHVGDSLLGGLCCRGVRTIRDETTNGPPVQVSVGSSDSDSAAKAIMTELGCYKPTTRLRQHHKPHTLQQRR